MVKQVFEYESIYLDDDFKRHHWQALARYNERHSSKYFTLLPDGVRFNQYVGVVQAGSLTIEILPKINRQEKDIAMWRRIMLHMLHECRFMKVAHPERATLHLHSGSILDAYLQLYLEEVAALLHGGLSKRYRRVEGNRSSLKGSLRFAQHIQQNIVHAERFYVRHTVYDHEHLLHTILYKALQVVNKISTGHAIKSMAGRLMLDFPDMPDIGICAETFTHLKLSRKESRYSEALLIAKMLLLQYRPDIQSGEEHVLALLFDMNKLWEEYVYRQMVKLEDDSFSVSRQESAGFWHLHGNLGFPRTIRPDIVVDGPNNHRIIIDTKWKLMEDDEPADDDLKQMFAYAHYFDSPSLFLLYPDIRKASPKGRFVREHHVAEGVQELKCSILKVPVIASENIYLDLIASDFL